VTVYLTEEQHHWAKRVAASAVDDGPALSASDVVRLALERLKGDGGDLRQALIEQAWTEAAAYPGRAKRGMPARTVKAEAE
jgi:Arc/MetJ-type ribon-helix-helix transcriptional regulator